MLKITLKRLLRALHISGRLACMISFVMPSLSGTFRILSILQDCNSPGLVTLRSKNVDVVTFMVFMSSVSTVLFLAWLTFTSALIKLSR